MNLRMELKDLIQRVKVAEGTDSSCAIRDILTDLAHICLENGLDFDDRVDAAIEIAHQENPERD